MSEFAIDAVVTWVDGGDPVWKAKKNAWLNGTPLSSFDDIAGDTRYASVGEVRYCVSSLLRFAPFLRKIFIVTPAQDPLLDEFLDVHFPERTTSVEVVDQDVLFGDCPGCLPVFNSLSVETMIWKIPDLSEHFIYLNDDFLVLRPLERSDLFTEDGRAVVYADTLPCVVPKIWKAIKPSSKGHKRFGLKDAMVNAADALGGRRTFLYFGHTPVSMIRSLMEGFEASHPGVLQHNADHRFRDPSQFHPQELCALLARDAGKLEQRPFKGSLLYLKPKRNAADEREYLTSVLSGFDLRSDARFCCFNSLDRASEDGRKMVKGWMAGRLGISE